jgi:hypothetical protein
LEKLLKHCMNDTSFELPLAMGRLKI